MKDELWMRCSHWRSRSTRLYEDAMRISSNPDVNLRPSPNTIVEPPTTTIRIKIINVSIVNGSSFPPNTWSRKMQKIETDKGMFIDNIPENKGFDWESKKGEFVTGYKINDSCGYRWLNKRC